ncbi:MAG TPA: tetratricopeptide repeat protein, partial [Gemmatimonadaceae bacterium]|nr:tetratricopeptide repeat protein [Gemmatimonadaceae bacterium]
IVCEVEPIRPSATLSRGSSSSTESAGKRGTTPDRLRRALSGDLDVIIMQALRKEPSRRYASAAAMLDDLKRFRDGLPVRARASSAGYRLGKFVRRRAAPLTVTALVLTILAGGAVRERVLRTRAQAEARKAEQTTDYMFSLFEASENGRTLSDAVSAQDLFRRGVAQARAPGTSADLRAQMLDVLGRLESDLGHDAEAKPLLVEALALRRELYGSDHPDVATSLGDLAFVLSSTGDLPAALAMHREQLAIRRRLYGEQDVKTTDAMFDLAQDLHEAGNLREAGPLFAEWQARVAKAPAELTRNRLRQISLLGQSLVYSGQPQRAESLARAELSLAHQLYGEKNDQVASALQNLGDALDGEGKRAESEATLREAAQMMLAAYPDGNESVSRALKQWSVELQRLSHFTEAEAPLRLALPIARRAVGDDSNDAIGVEQELAFVLTMLGKYDEALSYGQDALQRTARLYGTKGALYAHAQVIVADAVRGKGKFSEAEPVLLAAEERFRNKKGLLQNYWRSTVMALSRLYDAEGQHEKSATYRALVLTR